MAEKKKVSGIKVQFRKPVKDTDSRRKQVFDLGADFFAGFAEPSKTFISNQRIREAMEKFNSPKTRLFYGELVGTMDLAFEPASKTIWWKGYFPFGEVGGAKSVFAGKGTANLLELIMLTEMKKRFPGIKLVGHRQRPEPKRREQLSRREINWKSTYSFDEAIQKLKSRIAKGRIKANKARTGIKPVHRKTEKKLPKRKRPR